jgi:hypothetical protein
VVSALSRQAAGIVSSGGAQDDPTRCCGGCRRITDLTVGVRRTRGRQSLSRSSDNVTTTVINGDDRGAAALAADEFLQLRRVRVAVVDIASKQDGSNTVTTVSHTKRTLIALKRNGFGGSHGSKAWYVAAL